MRTGPRQEAAFNPEPASPTYTQTHALHMVAIATLLFPVMFVVGHLPCALVKLTVARWLAGSDALPSVLNVIHLFGVLLALAIALWVCRRAWPKPTSPTPDPPRR